jgi:multiple sugar transport system permease protein
VTTSTASYDYKKAAQARANRTRAIRGLQYLILSIVTLIFFAPIAYLLIGSFKPNDEVLAGLKGFIPEHLSFNNYARVFQAFDSDATGYFWKFYLTSVVVSLIIVVGGLVVNSMLAYALARLRWRGRNLVLGFVVLLVILPFEAIAVPLFDLMNGYRNTITVQAVPFIASAFSVYLFYTFFIGLPAEIQESARLDGAGPFRVFYQIIVPMSKPVFASVTILSFLSAWNSFLFPLMMIDSADVRPLPLAMTVFYQQQQKEWGTIFAFGVMLVLPVMIVFLIFQKFFIQSVASSAVKG